jgi:hypothetical protein
LVNEGHPTGTCHAAVCRYRLFSRTSRESGDLRVGEKAAASERKDHPWAQAVPYLSIDKSQSSGADRRFLIFCFKYFLDHFDLNQKIFLQHM